MLKPGQLTNSFKNDKGDGCHVASEVLDHMLGLVY